MMTCRGLSVNVAKPGCGAGTGAAARWSSRWCPATRARAVAEVHGHVGGYREADVRGHLLALIPSTRQSRYRGSASPHRGGAARQVPQHQWHERAEGRMGRLRTSGRFGGRAARDGARNNLGPRLGAPTASSSACVGTCTSWLICRFALPDRYLATTEQTVTRVQRVHRRPRKDRVCSLPGTADTLRRRAP
jgi:hypothetical protein